MLCLLKAKVRRRSTWGSGIAADAAVRCLDLKSLAEFNGFVPTLGFGLMPPFDFDLLPLAFMFVFEADRERAGCTSALEFTLDSGGGVLAPNLEELPRKLGCLEPRAGALAVLTALMPSIDGIFPNTIGSKSSSLSSSSFIAESATISKCPTT